VVRAEQHGQAAAGESLHKRPHVADPRRIEAVGRFVEHQQTRATQQAGGNPEPLPHAVGVAADLVVGPIDEVDDVEHLRNEVGPDAAVQQPEALQVLPAGQVGVELRALDEAGDPVEDSNPGLRPAPAEHANHAGIGPDQAEQHPQEGGLAGPVGSEDAVHLAGRHAEGDVVDRPDRSERLGHADHVDSRWIAHAAHRRRCNMKEG
jgi:hypothetical protein